MKEEILKLPKETQGAINAFDWTKVSEEIGQRYSFDENEINNFQIETGLFLLGFVDRDSYTLNVETEVGTSRNEAVKITEEVNQKIFNPVYNFLEENIKKSIKNEEPNWMQNLNFILTEGNYLAFLEKTTNKTDETPTTNTTINNGTSSKENLLVNFLKKEDTKSKFNI